MSKKVLFNVILFLMMFMSIFFVEHKVYANTMNQIDMDVYIDADGNAHITETWNAYLDEGTEGYRKFTKLGNSKITNFSVSDDSGATYTYISNWNTSADFESKVYQNGIHNISDGLELCWGISDYGNRTYTLTYTITDFVIQYTDAQGIYFNFVNLDQPIGNVSITIHSDTNFSVDNAKIWSFGYGPDGTIEFENGTIVLDSRGQLPSSKYMVALVKFEDVLFNTSNSASKSFDDIYAEATSDVEKSGAVSEMKIISILFAIVMSFFPMIIIIVIIAGIVVLFVNKDQEKFSFGTEGTTLPADSEIQYWREIPCDKDLEKAYWTASQYAVVSQAVLKKNIIGAILLKWIHQEQIKVAKTKKGLFSFKDNNYAIDFNSFFNADNDYEAKLAAMLKEAAGQNQILEAKEFEKWARNNYSKMESWFDGLIKYGTSQLENDGTITVTSEQVPAMFGKTKTITTKHVNSSMKEEAIKLKGLKKFLLEFSLIYEREHFEVHIWEEYLIFAQVLGIADKVEEQFSKLYPNFNQMSQLDIESTTIIARQMGYVGYRGMTSGASSDGSGGSSSSGGGGSSGGSSGGGFR